MKKDKKNTLNIKTIMGFLGILVFAVIVVVILYMELMDNYEKEFDLTSSIGKEHVITLTEGEKLFQRFQLTIEEPTAVSVKIAEEQENTEGINLLYSIYDENQSLIQSREYTESDIERDGQLYIHFEQPMVEEIYYLSVEIMEHEETDASLDLLIGNVLDDNTCSSNGIDTGVSLVIKQSNFVWSNDNFRIFCISITGILFVSIFVLAYWIFVKKPEFHWCYFAVAVVYGLIFMFIIPPYSVPDEQTHISVSLYLSSDWLGWDKYQGEEATFVGRLTEFDTGYNAYLSRDVYNDYLNKLFKPVTEDGQALVDSNHELASPFAMYTIPAIGVTIGRLLSLNGTMTFMLGRLFNLLFFISLVTYAIKKVPFGKMIIAGVCLLPMTLQQASSFSYDNPLIAAAMVVTALGIRWCYTEEKIKKSEIALYVFSSIILLIGKSGVYCTIIFLPFLYKFSKEKLFLLWNKYRIQSIMFVVVSVLIFLRDKISAVINSIFISSETETVKTVVESTGNIIKWTGTEGYTVGELLMNPIQLIRVILNTFLDNIDWYWGSMIGQSLGWFDISVPWLIVSACTLILLLATIKPVEEKGELLFRDKIIASGFSVISCGLCMAAMLILWTPKGTRSILGVQGRYFLPVLGTLLFALRTKKLQIAKNIDRFLLYAMFAVDIYAIYRVLQHAV